MPYAALLRVADSGLALCFATLPDAAMLMPVLLRRQLLATSLPLFDSHYFVDAFATPMPLPAPLSCRLRFTPC